MRIAVKDASILIDLEKAALFEVCFQQDPMVLDFANTQEEIEAAFQVYYGRTTLDRDTDPQKLYNMKFAVEEMALFTPAEVDQFADLFIRQKATSQKISPIFTKIILGTFAALKDEDMEKGKKDGTYRGESY